MSRKNQHHVQLKKEVYWLIKKHWLIKGRRTKRSSQYHARDGLKPQRGQMETPKFSLKGQLPRGDLVYWQYCLLPAPNQLFKKLPFPWIERSKITKKSLSLQNYFTISGNSDSSKTCKVLFYLHLSDNGRSIILEVCILCFSGSG